MNEQKSNKKLTGGKLDFVLIKVISEQVLYPVRCRCCDVFPSFRPGPPVYNREAESGNLPLGEEGMREIERVYSMDYKKDVIAHSDAQSRKGTAAYHFVL